MTVPGSSLHHLRGSILEAGKFAFRLQVVDKSCDPFLSTFADFEWDVVVGDLQIVGATIQGNNAFYPAGTYVKNGVVLNPDRPALKSVVYNAFSVIDLVVAGGVQPYSCQIVDDPSEPLDGNLPTGERRPVDADPVAYSALFYARLEPCELPRRRLERMDPARASDTRRHRHREQPRVRAPVHDRLPVPDDAPDEFELVDFVRAARDGYGRRVIGQIHHHAKAVMNRDDDRGRMLGASELRMQPLELL